MTARSFALTSLFGFALASFAIGSTAVAGPVGLIDDFSGDLSMYTSTVILDANGGGSNTAAWQINGGALQLVTTAYDGIEQYAFIRSGVTLEVGEEIQFDATHTLDSQDIGLYVGGTTPVAGTRQDYIAVYARNDGNVYSRGFDGTTEYGLVGGGTPAYESLFIARTAANTYEGGYYAGGMRNVFVERTPATPNDGDVVGFYADVRAVGTLGNWDNLRIPEPPEGPTLTIDRDTGEMTLSNTNPVAFNMLGYTISSAAGALNPANWQSITGNFDAASNGGDESFDNEIWGINTSTKSDWDEATTDFFFGDGGTLASGSPVQIGLANAWTKSIYEDVEAVMNIFSGNPAMEVSVVYTGNGDAQFQRSDLNFNGSVGPEDWPIFIGSHLADLSGMTQAEAYQQGDLNNSMTNDYTDWLLFREDFIAANGAAAWVALTGAAVPEPSAAWLTLLGLAGLVGVRRR